MAPRARAWSRCRMSQLYSVNASSKLIQRKRRWRSTPGICRCWAQPRFATLSMGLGLASPGCLEMSRRTSIADSVPVLEYIAGRYSEAWRMLADLYMELGGADNGELAKQALRRYLETNPAEDASHKAWLRLERLAWQTGDHETEFAAWLRIVEFPQTSFYDISTAANAMSRLLQGTSLVADPEVKRTAAQKVASAMEALLPVSNPVADDYSRLAWLYLYRNEPERARAFVDEGLRLEPQNPHCLNIQENYLR